MGPTTRKPFGSLLFAALVGYYYNVRGAQAVCDPVDIRITQGQSVNVQVQPIATSQTIEEFYAYGQNGKTSSYGGPTDILQVRARRSVTAIHQNTQTCELSLVVVHGIHGDGDLFNYAQIYLTGDLWNPLVHDDPRFTSAVILDDEIDGMFLRKSGMTLYQWWWPGGQSDGMANPLPPNYAGCFEILGKILPSEGPLHSYMQEWKFVSSNQQTTNLDFDEPLYICIGDTTESFPQNPFPRDRDFAYCDEPGYVWGELCGYCKRPICHQHWWCNIAHFINCNAGYFVIPQPG